MMPTRRVLEISIPQIATVLAEGESEGKKVVVAWAIDGKATCVPLLHSEADLTKEFSYKTYSIDGLKAESIGLTEEYRNHVKIIENEMKKNPHFAIKRG